MIPFRIPAVTAGWVGVPSAMTFGNPGLFPSSGRASVAARNR